MLRPYLRISAIPPCLPVILDARLPLPYLRGRVCASEGILFSLFGLELVPGVLMQTQSAGGLGDVDLRVPNAKHMLLPSIVTALS